MLFITAWMKFETQNGMLQAIKHETTSSPSAFHNFIGM